MIPGPKKDNVLTTSQSEASALKVDNVRGVALIALAFFAFSVTDMIAKFSTGSFNPFEVVWFRQLGLLSGVLIALMLRGPSILKTPRPWTQVARGALAAVSVSSFVVAVKFIPLVDAVAISFVAPFVVTAVGGLLLGEKVGPRRWTAVVIGFIGAMIVLRPGLGTFHPAALLVLVAATAFGLRQVLSRRLAYFDKTITTVSYTAIVSTALFSLTLPFIWHAPETVSQYALLAAMACCAATGEILIIKALEIGEAAAVAPVQYSLIIWGTLWGWLVFDELPDIWTSVGAAIIVATGLYVFQRERIVAARERKARLSS